MFETTTFEEVKLIDPELQGEDDDDGRNNDRHQIGIEWDGQEHHDVEGILGGDVKSAEFKLFV